MNNDTIDKIVDYLTDNNVDYDIATQIRMMLSHPSSNMIQEVTDFLRKQNIHEILILIIEDMLVTEETREEGFYV